MMSVERTAGEKVRRANALPIGDLGRPPRVLVKDGAGAFRWQG